HCTVRHRGGMVVDLFHSFTQPLRMDRQELRLFFERGDVTLEEWVPVRLRIRAIADEKQTRELMELVPTPRLEVTSWYRGKERGARGRGQTLDVYQKVE